MSESFTTAIGGRPSAPLGPAPPPVVSRTPLAERSLWLGLMVVRMGPALILVLLVAVMAVIAPFFLTERNLQNVLTQTSVIALLAMGQLLVIVVRGIDASVGSVVGLSTVTGALMFGTSLHGAAIVIATMLLTGIAIGLVNGCVFVYGRLPNSLINTLAMLYIAQGIAQAITHGDALQGMPGAVNDLGGGFVGRVPQAAILVAGMAVLATVFCRNTRWGRWIFAVGGNIEAARRVGIPVNRVLVSVFVISGLFAGLAGVITAGQTNAGYGLAGSTSMLDAIAAVFIGGASFMGGRGSIGGTLIGAFIIGCLRNGLDLLNVYPTWQLVAVGGVMLLAVELDVIRGSLETRFRVAQASRAVRA
jgi:ribose transport system permease protein